MRFAHGDAGSAAQGGRATRPGREGHARHLPASPSTFTQIEFDFAKLEHRLRELAFLNSGVDIVLSDLRGVEHAKSDCSMRAGSRPSSAISTGASTRCIPEPIAITAERDGVAVEAALWWNDGYHETVLCFTNNIPQRDGGTHLAGFRAALTRTINTYADDIGHRQEGEGAAHRRRHARRADLRAVGQGRRPEVLDARPRTSWSPPRCARRSKA